MDGSEWGISTVSAFLLLVVRLLLLRTPIQPRLDIVRVYSLCRLSLEGDHKLTYKIMWDNLALLIIRFWKGMVGLV